MPRSLATALFAVLLCTPNYLLATDTLADLVAGEVELVREGFEFTEGPAMDLDGNVYFTDIPAEKIHRLDLSGEITTAIEGSKHTNGLMFDGAGKLIGCQMDGEVVVYDLNTKSSTVLAGEFDGKRFNAPNDLTIDKQGGIYFTDPLFRAPNPLPQETMGVYYRDPTGKVHQVIKDLPAPNGIGLSADESTLYVIPTQSSEMLAYTITEAGKVGESRVLCALKQPEDQPASRPGGGDGMTLDEHGNLYITTQTGLQVFSSAGEYVGTISLPQQPANVAFGGKDGKTLVITARTGVYRVAMKVAGQRATGTVPAK